MSLVGLSDLQPQSGPEESVYVACVFIMLARGFVGRLSLLSPLVKDTFQNVAFSNYW